MKLKPEVNQYFTLMGIDEVYSARVMCVAGSFDSPSFYKLMVFYRNGNPIWAHKDCVVPKSSRLPRKSRKNRRKRT